MATDSLTLLKSIDAQIAALDKIVKGGDYIGAGLDITLEVLPRNDEDLDDDDAPPRASMRMQLTHDVDVLMALLRKDLVARREVVAAAAQGDLAELRDFLAGEPPAAPSQG